jgi:protein-tyrosine phosphatase
MVGVESTIVSIVSQGLFFGIEGLASSPPPEGASPCWRRQLLSPSLLMSSVNVIFVCMGNICRSPMAASVLRSELEKAGLTNVQVSSAGTGGWHVGDPADRRAQAALARRGYQTEHNAQQFVPGSFGEYDLVVAMDRDNLRDLRRLAPTRFRTETLRLMLEFDPDAESLDVPDPYYGSSGDFDLVLDLLEPACRGLVAHLQTTT